MMELSRQSAQRYLEEVDDFTLLEEDLSHMTQDGDLAGFSAPPVLQMWRDLLDALETYHRAGDNVLYLDVDTLCIKKSKVFDIQQMMMFWLTDFVELKTFYPYLNGGVVYIPAAMNESMWQFSHNQDLISWDSVQLVFNAMFYAQDPVPGLMPEYNWSPNITPGCAMSKAKIMHFTSTKGWEKALAEMERMAAL